MKPFCYHSFDLRQLVSFAEIARAGSFRQAATELLGSRLQRLGITAGDCDPGALGHKQSCGGKSNAAITTGNQRNFVGELHSFFKTAKLRL
jgi:hypothetical protein